MSQETKIKIIAAARKLFVEKGFAGTSMSMIAQSAKVNHALLFYHYKNKENLWTETKIAIFHEATKSSKLLPDDNLPFEAFLRKLISNTVKFYQNNPDMIRMVNWQRLRDEKQDQNRWIR
ncbi:MAG UNVERIFIED_CONTAM: TetR/AcrR family transcriptional regulator [Rickettsiaceae bacterium]|jgi:AcrR family transcriptional regulator